MLLSCSSDDEAVLIKSDAKAITSFIFNASDNMVLSSNIAAIINEDDKTITANLPAGTDVSSLTPEINISPLASLSPEGAKDFSSVVTYTVTAEDGSTVSYLADIALLALPNSAPQAFNLITVPNNDRDTDLFPVFSWENSVDSDGDTVVYDIYLNKGSSASVLYASNLAENNFIVTEPLLLEQNYSWKVVAKDPQGAVADSGSRSFTTRGILFNGIAINDNADFAARAQHTSVAFNGRMWVIGGRSLNENTDDVWSSADGTTWFLETNAAPFGTLKDHTSVVFDNQIWAIAGSNINGDTSDVWSSSDGKTWKVQTNQAEFGARSNHSSFVFDNKIWVVGGMVGNNTFKNDVWSSVDGITWKEEVRDAPFAIRGQHSTVVLDDVIYLIGGLSSGLTLLNDVWLSKDGITWELAKEQAPFTARREHTSFVFNEKVWVLGGRGNNSSTNDIWYTVDGVTWTSATGTIPFSERYSHSSLILDNKVWIVGGIEGNNLRKNDVWLFE
jgi:hypothetical protein